MTYTKYSRHIFVKLCDIFPWAADNLLQGFLIQTEHKILTVFSFPYLCELILENLKWKCKVDADFIELYAS